MIEPVTSSPHIEKADSPLRSSIQFDFSSSLFSMGSSYSCFSWIWGKITSFFAWLFCCCKKTKEEDHYSYFRVDDQANKQVIYRLIEKGERTECEIKLTYKTAALNVVDFPDRMKREQIKPMLLHAIKEEKVNHLIVQTMDLAKLCIEAGLVTESRILIKLDATFFHSILKEAFANKGFLSWKGKMAVEDCRKVITEQQSHHTKYSERIVSLQNAIPGFVATSSTGSPLKSYERRSIEALEGNQSAVTEVDIPLGSLFLLIDELKREIPRGLLLSPHPKFFKP